MAWIYLLIASVFEIAWVIAMKYSHGFTRLWPSVFLVVASIVSLLFLGLASKKLPIGTAYAIWTGIGSAGTVALGVILFNESREWPRLICVALIICGIIGLKVVSTDAG